MYAGFVGLGWLIPQPSFDRWYAAMDQSALVNTPAVVDFWASCCPSLWLAIPASITAHQLYRYLSGEADFVDGNTILVWPQVTNDTRLLLCSGGTVLGGIVGLFWRVLVGRQSWLAVTLAVAFAITLTELTSVAYPPGDTL